MRFVEAGWAFPWWICEFHDNNGHHVATQIEGERLSVAAIPVQAGGAHHTVADLRGTARLRSPCPRCKRNQTGKGVTRTVSRAEYSRILPHAFHDQALSSLPHLFPKHVLLASRQSGVLGEVAYALVSFKEIPSSEQVVF